MQKIIKRTLKSTLAIFGTLTIIAFLNLLSSDYKEKRWYTEKLTNPGPQRSDTITTVCILATVHQANPNYTADSIVNILNQFQPDLILTEEDTLLFQTVHKSYNQTLQKKLLARLGRSFGFGGAEEIEAKAVRKYKISHPVVDIRPFDYEGRNAFYQAGNTFQKENEAGNRLGYLANSHSLTADQAKIWSTYSKINDTLNGASIQTPYSINQPVYYELTERRQHYQYHKIAEIINAHDSLKTYRDFYKSNSDFWDIRNKKMAEHICNFITGYSIKRIIVLTGSMHKYYLLRELAPLQHKLKFSLKEYYD